ncbi:pneumococcal surface protein PspC, LPXTG-anchored form [Streptococcus pneumoniae]|nr:pneumococcal surface protein PspC, LPXTG-anchored form [Streptococcus pneumoniae]MDS2583268.1 pneumococcal surface protein PspC, LPXTG-anchored form [Streptococcus pneumoniae]MDS2777538.1 pneumococcal surface protein PspC, LPXTG-anchored form [Streptococcus pneumoniae]MDS2888692.1 pneumococcal surface protein PspC, LPXTG-anchored form [Streptococcus pneumoniae]
MFASKSERKVHYSIRKFSIGVASVAVASLFMGSVVHATENEGTTQAPTSSNRGNESQAEQRRELDLERDKVKKEVREYKEKKVKELYSKSTKSRHKKTVDIVNKLQNINNEYLNKIIQSTSTYEELQKLMMESQSEVDKAVSEFEKDLSSSSSSGSSTEPEASDTAKPNKPTELEKKVAEAQQKVEEAEKKAKDQKEEDHRNYPTITYKTLELEIAEFDVKVKEAELELLKVKAKESRDEKKIKQAEAEVESKQAEATRLKKIKTDRKKAEEEAKLKEAVEKNAATSEQGKPKRRVKRGALGEQATPDKKDYFEKDFRPAFNKNQQMVAIQESLNKLDDETKTVPDGAKLTGEAGNAYNEVRDYAIKVVSENKKLLSQTAVTMDELAMQLTKLNDAMSKLKEAKAKLVPEVKPQPENPEHQKPTTPAPDTKPIPQPEGKKPSVPDINQEKEKAKLAVATYMSKILDDIQKHHLQKEKHRQIVALIKELDEFKKQALSEIDNVNTKVEIENTVHKIFADMDAVVTKFKKGLTQDTPKEPDNKKPSAPKPDMQPSPQPEGKKPSVPAQPGTEDKKPSAPKPGMQPSPQPEGKKPSVPAQPGTEDKKPSAPKPDMQPSPQPEGKKPSVPAQPGTEDKKPSAPKPDMQPSPQPEGKKPSVPEINQEKEKAKLAVATEKKLPSTGVASNLVLEIIGLLGLIGTSFIAMKRRK